MRGKKSQGVLLRRKVRQGGTYAENGKPDEYEEHIVSSTAEVFRCENHALMDCLLTLGKKVPLICPAARCTLCQLRSRFDRSV